MRNNAFLLIGATLLATPLMAQTPAPTAQAAAPTAAAAMPNVTVGAAVSDASGAPVGTIEAVSGGNATISTGTAKAGIPLTSFAQGPNGLVIGMTKAQIEAAVSQAARADIAVGTPVSDGKGGKVGTVEAVTGDMVTVATANAKAQLPKTAFAKSDTGLVIGMTAGELEAAAKAAAPPAKKAS